MPPSKIFAVFDGLTAKQHEALALAAQHLTSKQIALELNVAPATIDKRIEAVRGKLDQMPRSELLRHYVEWSSTPDQTIADHLPLPDPGQLRASKVSQPAELRYEFEDAVPMDLRVAWDRQPDGLLSRIELSNLSKLGKVGAMFVGSLALVIGFVLLVTSAQAVKNLLGV